MVKVGDVIKLPSIIPAVTGVCAEVAPMHRICTVVNVQAFHGRDYISIVMYGETGGSYSYYFKNDFPFEILGKNYKQALRLLSRQSMSIGNDPEIFVTKGDGSLFPAYEFLPGKNTPLQNNRGNSAYWDGFQAEFTTAPQNCLAYAVDKVQHGLELTLEAARKVDPRARLSMLSTWDIPVESLLTAKDEHVAFGCMPSLNAYEHSGITMNGREVPFRSAGGHIHFGLALSPEVAKRVVKTLDAVLGVMCVSLFAAHDSPTRRKMYGLAGEYRLPKHGLEYRVLSNAWLCHPLIMHLVYEVARACVNVGRMEIDAFAVDESDVCEAINNCNVIMAQRIMADNKENIIALMSSVNLSEEVFDIFLNGVDSVVADFSNIEKNWELLSGKYVTHSGLKQHQYSTSRIDIIKGKKVG